MWETTITQIEKCILKKECADGGTVVTSHTFITQEASQPWQINALTSRFPLLFPLKVQLLFKSHAMCSTLRKQMKYLYLIFFHFLMAPSNFALVWWKLWELERLRTAVRHKGAVSALYHRQTAAKVSYSKYKNWSSILSCTIACWMTEQALTGWVKRIKHKKQTSAIVYIHVVAVILNSIVRPHHQLDFLKCHVLWCPMSSWVDALRHIQIRIWEYQHWNIKIQLALNCSISLAAAANHTLTQNLPFS